MCIKTIGTSKLATVGSISKSNVPPEISLIRSAPASIDALATVALVVSTEIGTVISGRKTCNIGNTRFNYSARLICAAPGRVD